MELRHLRYFVAVAETENVSRAALHLHISQPAVSRQVRDLEDEIGFALLKRVGKSVRLTEAGRVFLNEARAILARTDEALRNVRALDEHQRIELHVGYCSYAIDPLFHRILRTYQGVMPNVRVKLHDRKVEENVDALLEGRLHLAFIFHAPKPGALRGLRGLSERTEQLVAEMTEAYERYWTPALIRSFESFVDDLSNWYIRRSRRRFWDGDQVALWTLWHALVRSVQTIAPVMPFLADFLWRRLRADDAPESVQIGVRPQAVIRGIGRTGRLVVAQGLAKQAIDSGLDGPLADGLALEQQLFAEVFSTEDAITGVRSFLESGPGKARFSGR